jgi:hypothetical protein
MQGKVAILVAMLAGCASTRLALEKPIAGQCESSGLTECGAITEGVIMYVEGDQRLAYQKLHIAAGLNEPDDVIDFAGALKVVTRNPAAARHAAAIDEIAELLAREAREAAQRLEAREAERAAAKRKKAAIAAKTSNEKRTDGNDAAASDVAAAAARATLDGPNPTGAPTDAPAKGKTVPASTAAAPSPAIGEIEGRTVVPATDEGNRACVMSGIMSPSAQSSRGYCVRVARGPLVVTDLHSSSACPAELFALSVVPGDLSAPRWAVYGQPESRGVAEYLASATPWSGAMDLGNSDALSPVSRISHDGFPTT